MRSSSCGYLRRLLLLGLHLDCISITPYFASVRPQQKHSPSDRSSRRGSSLGSLFLEAMGRGSVCARLAQQLVQRTRGLHTGTSACISSARPGEDILDIKPPSGPKGQIDVRLSLHVTLLVGGDQVSVSGLHPYIESRAWW